MLDCMTTGETADSGKVALVTGANKGIGFETARLLGERGMTVLAGSRDADRGRKAVEELVAGGVDAHAVRLDVTDEASVEAAAAWIGGAYGRLDVLVNNAGIAPHSGFTAPTATGAQALREAYETNVFGVVAVVAAVMPLLRAAEAARIVNVSSEVGSIAAMTDPGHPLGRMPASLSYPSSKTALNMVTAMYAKELADTPIKVNAANPGYCATDLNGRSGVRTAEQGAEVSVHLATLPADGPSGVLWGHLMGRDDPDACGVLPW
ncbi:SDR family oxidoreductase [Nocardiopsis composta]